MYWCLIWTFRLHHRMPSQRAEKNPSLLVKRRVLVNNNFDFQTSKQIFGFDYEKGSGAQSNIITRVQQNNSLE